MNNKNIETVTTQIYYSFNDFEPKKLSNNPKGLLDWLTQKAGKFLSGEKNEINVYMLSHHEDGVVWGRLEVNENSLELKTSDGLAASPSFMIETLQECRLFSFYGELMLWRIEKSVYESRMILDRTKNGNSTGNIDNTSTEAKVNKKLHKTYDSFTEDQILWGKKIEKIENGFTIVQETHGVCHAYPREVEESFFYNNQWRPLRMQLRHYIDYDNEGCAYVSFSRLLTLKEEKEQREEYEQHINRESS